MELCKNEHVHWGTKNISIATLNLCVLPLGLTNNNISRTQSLVASVENHNSTLGPIDVLFVQEVFSRKALLMLCEGLGQLGYYYSHSSDSRIINFGGLATFTRSTVEKSEFTSFNKQGKLFSAQASDRMVRKGVLHTRSNGINYLNAHSTSPYDLKCGENTLIAQTEQLLEIAQSLDSQPIIGGDLNFKPDSAPYKLITKYFNDFTRAIGDTWHIDRNQHRSAKTQFTKEKSGQLDFVFFPKNWSIKRFFASIIDDSKAILSDHKMVYVRQE